MHGQCARKRYVDNPFARREHPGFAYGDGTEPKVMFFEALSIRKFGPNYFVLTKSGELCYAVSDCRRRIYLRRRHRRNCIRIDITSPPICRRREQPWRHRKNRESICIFYHRHTNGTWYAVKVALSPSHSRRRPDLAAEMTSCDSLRPSRRRYLSGLFGLQSLPTRLSLRQSPKIMQDI